MNKELLERIDATSTISELNGVFSLPEPYDDAGYYMVYYSERDYRYALPEIVDYIESGMRIYYDRYLETGEAHIRDYCRHAVGSHCRCIVFYLSDNVFDDPTFLELVRVVGERELPCISINRTEGEDTLSGEVMAMLHDVPEDCAGYISRLFAEEVTFIPFSLPLEEKKRELRRAYEKLTMHFTVVDNYAVAEYVKDLSEEEVVIPPSIEINGTSYPVRAVSARAFSGCRELTRVVFPDTVEDIGYGCDDESAGEVFENCESLTEIVYPPMVKRLYGGMFAGCKSLKRLILNDSCEFVGDKENHFSFEVERGGDLKGRVGNDDVEEGEIVINPHPLERLHLPKSAKLFFVGEDSVRFAYNSAGICFTSYLSVGELTGGEVIEIGESHEITTVTELYMLAQNKNIRDISFPRDFVFGERWFRVFYECTGLKRVVLPETVIALDHVFYKCESLEQILLPDSVAEIGVGTFYECKSLRSINLPRCVCSVSDSAFLGCHLERVVCDSLYAYNIFKSGYRKPPLVYMQQSAFMRFFVNLLMRLFGTSRDQAVTKGIQWWTEIDNIYIKNDVKEFDIEGYERVESDMSGYRKYVCRISYGERLRFKGRQFELRNK